MRFHTHLLSSLALGLALYRRQPAQLATLVAAGTLIDIDHLLLYGLQTGDWSVVGALRYDRYRNRRAGVGDTRPRYGSLRSWLHNPLLTLPPLWALAVGRPRLRAMALGLSLHLLLDHPDWLQHTVERWRSGGACRNCGRTGQRLRVVQRGRHGTRRYRAMCRACAKQMDTGGEAELGACRPR
jgi:hypothetical protein